MTFQAYLRSRRLNEAFGRIKHTRRATDSADGICLLEFTDRRMLETQIQRLQQIPYGETRSYGEQAAAVCGGRSISSTSRALRARRP